MAAPEKGFVDSCIERKGLCYFFVIPRFGQHVENHLLGRNLCHAERRIKAWRRRRTSSSSCLSTDGENGDVSVFGVRIHFGFGGYPFENLAE